MRISGVRGIAFEGAIIDSHMHLGLWGKNGNSNEFINFDSKFVDTFVKSPLEVTVQGAKQEDSVEKVILSNLDCFVKNGLKDEITGNNEMLAACEKNPKFFALAACQPSKTGGNAVNINKLLQENPDKFIGLKFHPRTFNLAADNDAYKSYMKLAERHKLPCVFHSDVKIDDAGNLVDEISSPKAIYKMARKFPEVPVVMAHMGAGDAKSHQHAIDILLESVKNNDAKLYVDLSWVDWGKDGLSSGEKPSVVKLIQELQKHNATERILFGTDAPLGCFGEDLKGGLSAKQAYEKAVGDLKTVIKENFKENADELINKIFYKNADSLFFKKEWATPKEHIIKSTPMLKIAAGVGAVLAALAGVSYLTEKLIPEKDPRFDK